MPTRSTWAEERSMHRLIITKNILICQNFFPSRNLGRVTCSKVTMQCPPVNMEYIIIYWPLRAYEEDEEDE